MKKVLLFIAVICITSGAYAQKWSEGFENLPDFQLDDIPNWDFIDVDQGTTYGIEIDTISVQFPNSGYVGSALVFNNSSTTPVLGTNWDARTGDKTLIFIASGSGGTTMPNDDWAILPQMDIVAGDVFSFWAKSITDAYGLERFQIAITTTINSPLPSDFTIISNGNYVEAAVDWEEFSYDLSDYAGQTVRLAVHYVGNDSFVMLTDDYKITNSLAVSEVSTSTSKFYVSLASDGQYQLQLPSTFAAERTQFEVYSLTGQKVKAAKYTQLVDFSNLPKGVYIIKATDGKVSESAKFIKK